MKAIFLGVLTGEGTSKKTGKTYDFSQIRLLRPAKGFKSDSAEFHASGFKESTASCSADFYEQASKLPVNPMQLVEYEFVVDNQFNDYDQLTAVVVGIKDLGIKK